VQLDNGTILNELVQTLMTDTAEEQLSCLNECPACDPIDVCIVVLLTIIQMTFVSCV